jgi:hypothetical protein
VLPVASTALLFPGASGVRERVLAVLLVWLLPALALASLLGWRLEPVPRSLSQVDAGQAVEAVLLLVLAALPLVRGRWSREGGTGDERGRRTILCLLVTALFVALAAPWTSALFAERQTDLVRLASLAAAVLAAGGIVDLVRGGVLERLLGLALVLALVAGGGVRAWSSHRDAMQRAERTFDLALEADGLRSTRDDDLSRAYDWIRTELSRDGVSNVLLRSVERREDHLGRNLLPHLAPLLTGLSAWCDWSDAYACGDARWELRHGQLVRLYGESRVGEPATDWDPTFLQELERLGRPALILVEEDDRRGSRMQLERRIGTLGARRIHDEGSVALWSWSPHGERSR